MCNPVSHGTAIGAWFIFFRVMFPIIPHCYIHWFMGHSCEQTGGVLQSAISFLLLISLYPWVLSICLVDIVDLPFFFTCSLLEATLCSLNWLQSPGTPGSVSLRRSCGPCGTCWWCTWLKIQPLGRELEIARTAPKLSGWGRNQGDLLWNSMINGSIW